MRSGRDLRARGRGTGESSEGVLTALLTASVAFATVAGFFLSFMVENL
ncbi:Hypothetical Protein RradSPS_2659 [Rubrobacter radiotolerans]|uniref:Uncharacterized protein n=1 Tax=Rubrobacter radiotolerans TaxID=42256 RepID=A0A023X650_RUBRA|nr:Hypothetical Protein RradSPS_2659 [Rubrobacter radiotolerans]